MRPSARRVFRDCCLVAAVFALVVPAWAVAQDAPPETTVPEPTVAPTTAPAPTTVPPTTAAPPAPPPTDLPTTTAPPTSTAAPTTTTPPATTAARTPATPTTTATTTEAPTTSAAASTTQPPTSAAPTTAPGDIGVLTTPDPSGTFTIDKVNTADGDPGGDDTTAEPGDSYTYNITATCTSIQVDCADLTVTDTFPADVVVDESTIPPSIPGFREVSYDPATQTLTVVYIQDLDNPPDETGLQSGGSDNFIVSVTLPPDTSLETGDVIPNEATATGLDNTGEPSEATDPSDVIVNVPVVLDAGATKEFTDGNAIAGDPNATTTMQLGGSNESSSSAEVTEMTIEDSTADTFEYLDFTEARVTEYPEGATQAQLFTCPAASAPCDETEWVAGGTATPPAPSTLDPAPTAPGDVVGVRVVFTTPDGEIIPSGATAGVEVDMALRETRRSDGQVIAEIPATTVINNQSSTTVVDPNADPSSASGTADAQYQILPPTLTVTPTKSFFPDGNGNYQTDTGEHAVIGENSGVSMVINATNESAFPISEIVITEPAPPPAPASEWDKFDASEILLTFPAGAANANVVLTFDDGSTTTTDYPAPGPTTIDVTPPPRVTSMTVTYTGDPDIGGGNTLEPGATAGVSVHGNLNDNVDASDVGDLAGIDNCAHMDAAGTPYPGGSGTATGNACDTVPVEARNAGAGGTKTASQDNLPVNQPVLFTMNTTNNSNLPLINLMVTDPTAQADGTPPTPGTDSVWYWGQFLDANVTPSAMADRVTIEVFTPAGGWQELSTVDPSVYPDVIGVRGVIATLNPSESFSLHVEMISRVPLPDGEPPASLVNCYGITADTENGEGEFEAQEHCSDPIAPSPIEESAAVNKSITPESLPYRIPGMTPENATVNLQVRNTGTLAAGTLQITDNDPDFWDAVDFVGLGDIQAPDAELVNPGANANRIQIDAFVDGAWAEGTPTTIDDAALPAGVANSDVRGLRFTFSHTSAVNDGFVLTPCDPDDQGCTGIVEFQVTQRLNTVSTGEPLAQDDPCPEPDPAPTGCAELLDTASGAFTTQLHPVDPELIPDVTDDLIFVPGTPALDVNKGPENSTVQPGQRASFTLTTTNSGTANLPDVTVSDPLPDGILFDQSFNGGDPPYVVTWSNLPDGYPEPPDAVFETTPDPADPTRVGMLRWTFPGFEMPPNAEVEIQYGYTLEPGVTAGQEITNTMGASSPVDDLVCSDPNDGQVTDGEFGDGLYCTDPANVTVTAGASFSSRKWVAGNPELGWYNEATGENVPVGGGGCLSLEGPEGTYTTNPCIGLVNPGEDFHYVLRVQNAGTASAAAMTIVDSFPAPGDTGIAGEDRGTEWETAPTLTGPATYNGLPAGTIQYGTGTPCAGGFADWPCDDVTWGDDPGGATALRMNANFDPDPLAPGGTVDVYFSMTAPQDVPQVDDPTVAYNSLAHGETLTNGNDVAPLEPLRVGVATMYGGLELNKEIGDNPANLPVDGLTYEFTYECTLTNGEPWTGNGTADVNPGEPTLVEGIPAGSTCTVTETGTNGGVPSDPVTVEIEADETAQPVFTPVTITNAFPMGQLEITKTVTGDAAETVGDGPFAIRVDCTFQDESVAGFPQEDVAIVPGEPTVIPDVPVGAECTITETDDGGATTVTYDPANEENTAAVVIVQANENDNTASIVITNDFPIGQMAVLKEVTGGVIPVFTAGPYPATVDCTFEGGDVDGFPQEVELVPGSPVGVGNIPVGSVCTVTETDDRGATTVTYDPANADGSAGEVAIPPGDDETVSVTITNDFPVGGLQVIKQIGVNEANLELDDVPYEFHYECSFDPGDGQVITIEGDLVATANPDDETEDTVDGLPAGAVCEVWETEAHGGIPSATEASPAEVTIEAGTIAEPYTQVSVTNDYPTGRAELAKTIEGDAQDEFTAGPYLVRVNCWAEPEIPGEGEPFVGFPLAVELFPDEPVGTDLPVGTTCWFQEPESEIAPGVQVTYNPPNGDGTAGMATVPPEEPPDDGVFGTVSLTNTYTTGSLVIEKEVSGPGAPAFSGGPFVFDVTCGYLGVDDVFSTTVTIEGSTDGSTVESEPVTGLPIDAECTVTEVEAGGADTVTPPQTVTIEENEQENVAFVGMNNAFSAGTISVVKNVDGSAADTEYVQGLTYTIQVECAIDDDGEQGATVLDEEVQVTGDGEAVTVVGENDDPILLPVGTRCWGSEPTGLGATVVAIDANSFETGAVVGASDELQPLQIDVVNTFDRAELTVEKIAVDSPDPSIEYTFTIACTIEGAGEQIDAPLLGGESPFTLREGESANFEVLVGSTCTVSETDVSDDVTVTITESGDDNDDDDGVVVVNSSAEVTVTNTYERPDVGPSTETTSPPPAGILPITGVGLGVAVAALVTLLVGLLLIVRGRQRRPN